MLKTKPILKFLLLFVLIFGILVSVSPFFSEQTGSYMTRLGTRFLHSPVKNSYVTFLKTKNVFDVETRVGNSLQQVNGTVQSFVGSTSSYKFAYIPFALLVALILASPVSSRRKGIALFSSLFIFHLVLLLRMFLKILQICSQHNTLNLITPGPFLKNLIEWLGVYFVDYSSMMLYIVVLIWLAVTFRKEDLAIIHKASKMKTVKDSA